VWCVVSCEVSLHPYQCLCCPKSKFFQSGFGRFVIGRVIDAHRPRALA
jgi:hypothetical protein